MAKEISAVNQFFSKKGVTAKGVPLKTIEGWRQRVGKRYKPDGSPESSATLAVQRELDGLMDDALAGVADDILTGNPVAMATMKEARNLARKKIVRWDKDRTLRALMDKEDIIGADNDITKTFVLNASEAAKKLFGVKGQPGVGAEKALRRMRDILGEGSPEWAAFKSDALFKMFPGDMSGMNREAITAASNKFVRDFTTGLREHPEYFQTLFGNDTQILVRLSAALRDVGTKRAGVQNFSNSFNVLARNLGSFGSLLSHYVDKVVGPISRNTNVQGAISGSIPTPQLTPGVAGGTSALVVPNPYGEK